jgi:DNA-binding protein HU-beta
MRKLDIVNQIHSKTNINRQDIKKVVESFMKEIKQSLNNGQNIYLRGFGTFELKKRAEKTARNILKNKTIKVPAHHIPKFKPSKSFKNEVLKNNII